MLSFCYFFLKRFLPNLAILNLLEATSPTLATISVLKVSFIKLIACFNFPAPLSTFVFPVTNSSAVVTNLLISFFDEKFICFTGAKEICGKEYTIHELLTEIIKDKVFYDASGGGVTFSGGECMLQIDFLKKLLKKCKEANIHTAVDTAGNLPWEYFKKILPHTDLFLYDIKSVSENLHIEGTGVSNKTILNNLKLLSKNYDGEIIIRIPIIPGFNANSEEINKISDFLSDIKYKSVELLPYHNMSKHKYEALNIHFEPYEVPTESQINILKNLLNIQ